MSCDAAALALTLRLAAMRPQAADVVLLRVASVPAPAPLSREPLFASIVQSARRLQGEVARRRAAPAPGALDSLHAQADALAALDMQGHLELARRGGDGDLKCILRGLSQDIPRRMAQIEAAPEGSARKAALDELSYLLRDNVEVITTPAAVTSTDVAG